MKTWSFIGSDKNAGKTTVLNYVYRRLRDTGSPICLTSIGINGEELDNFEQFPKPRIPLYRGTWFVTAAAQLRAFPDAYETVQRFVGPRYRKEYLLGRCREEFVPVLEGPNDREEILLLKDALAPLLPEGYLLVDGSIDRQFLGHPRISDGICFALLVSPRAEQQRKAADLLHALSLPQCRAEERELIAAQLTEPTRSLLLDLSGVPLYRGLTPPFLDQELKSACRRQRAGSLLYLNGALTRSLHDVLAPLSQLRLVLDNFTLYQNVSVVEGMRRPFRAGLSLLHPVLVRHIFLNREPGEGAFEPVPEPALPPGIPVHDLFRDPDEAFRL